MATNTKQHYWVETYYGPARPACGAKATRPAMAPIESYPATTCNDCIDELDKDGADD